MTSAEETTKLGNSTLPPLSKTTPSHLAKVVLSSGLKALHPQLRDNDAITGIATKIIQLFFTLRSREKSVKKFEDDEYIPASCRLIKVELKGSTLIRDTDDYNKLEEESREVISTFKNKMSKFMMRASELEIKAVQNELMEKTVKFADLIMKQQLLNEESACREHVSSNELTIKVFYDDRDELNNEITIRLNQEAFIDTLVAQASVDGDGVSCPTSPY